MSLSYGAIATFRPACMYVVPWFKHPNPSFNGWLIEYGTISISDIIENRPWFSTSFV